VAEASNQSKKEKRYGIKTEDNKNIPEEPPAIWQSPYLSAIITGRLSYWQKASGKCKFQPKSTPYFTPKVHH